MAPQFLVGNVSVVCVVFAQLAVFINLNGGHFDRICAK